MDNFKLNSLGALLCLGAILAAAPGANAQGVALDDERLFATDRLVEIEIEIAKKDWDALRRQARGFAALFTNQNEAETPYKYVKGDISIDGLKIASVGIRKKGFIGSLDEERPSLKIKFDEYVKQDPIKGVNRLTLNNNKQDTGQISQYLSYKLYNAAGVHAPRCNLARVTVNGKYLGIYSNVESIKKPFLKNRFGDQSGNLFEGTITDFYPKAINRLEVKTNRNAPDLAKVMRLAELLAAKEKLSVAEVEKVVDVDAFLKFWAMESLIAWWDGYSSNQNNFYVYENPRNGKLYFIPWGVDAALTGRNPLGGFGGGGRGTIVYAQGMLANRLYHADGIPDRYRDTMRNLLETVWKEDELVADIERIEELIKENLHRRQRSAARSMRSVKRFIRSRREQVMEALEDWPARIPDQPRKPAYTVEVGIAVGTFAAAWHEERVEKPLETGTASIRLELNGEAVTFDQLGVIAQSGRAPNRWGRPSRSGDTGAGRAARPVNLVFTGIRASDDEQLTLTLTMSREAFTGSAGKAVAVQGTLIEGDGRGFGFAGRRGMRTVSGEVKFAAVGLKAGDAVEGEINVKFVETRGGFAGGGGRNQPRQRPPPVLTAIDADGDGNLSAEEIENAPEALKALDRNNDGKISAAELRRAQRTRRRRGGERP